MADPWTNWRQVLTRYIQLRPYVPGEDLSNIGVSSEVKLEGGPKVGDYVARDPRNHDDQWMLSAKYVAANYEQISGARP